MTTAEAALALNVRAATISQYIRRGLIAATYNDYARRWEIEAEEVERFARERRTRGRQWAAKGER